ncbi:methylated-DNA--[protein]-cysteine S-methyltransferase [Lysinibacter cavernae]|uniref:Methylated-DNA--protein-cysteine methyltransferase n=1 Tax=Lysinibacter cavernae TaxID=1640652 RepID=A0A7X5R0D1_9MICO|nr:methylated-DNA--[protein]-cysteine S-methyltransferase [Lysinibacter cavernae]NIH53132.1 methylated-DNA-[protein]-cysteine S-methyltransferase [Lysinibacter cavernae]
MTDSDHRRHAVYESSLGPLTMVGGDDGLEAIYFPEHWTNPDATTFGDRVPLEELPCARLAATQLGEYLDGQRRTFDLKLNPTGNEFQLSVWAILQEIPYGSTVTYGDIAKQLGSVNLARRVGGAVGSNPLSIIVPCHRVIGSTGSLTGYAGGLERKRHLLQLEEPGADESGKLF